MDPLGFALENFDAIGRWRTRGPGADARSTRRAVLPDGSEFAGSAGLREFLLRDKSQFAGALTEKLLTYALGRGVEYYDQPGGAAHRARGRRPTTTGGRR